MKGRYTEAELATLRRLAAAGHMDTEIAKQLGRSAYSITSARRHYGIPAGMSKGAKATVSNYRAYRQGLRSWHKAKRAENGGHLTPAVAHQVSAKGGFILPIAAKSFLVHTPDDLCGGRRLQGAEFRARKAELEKRDGTRL